MKKLISMLVTAALAVTSVFALAGCNSANGGNGGAKASNFKVGAIYINSQNDTSGYTYAHHHGITEGMKKIGLDRQSTSSQVTDATSSSVSASVTSTHSKLRLRNIRISSSLTQQVIFLTTRTSTTISEESIRHVTSLVSQQDISLSR